jgi:hypothetical protein
MMAVLRANSVHDWASRFLEALVADAKAEKSDSLAETSIPGVDGVTRPDSVARFARTDPQISIRRAPSAMPRPSSKLRFGPMQALSKAPQRMPPLRRNGTANKAADESAQN